MKRRIVEGEKKLEELRDELTRTFGPPKKSPYPFVWLTKDGYSITLQFKQPWFEYELTYDGPQWPLPLADLFWEDILNGVLYEDDAQ